MEAHAAPDFATLLAPIAARFWRHVRRAGAGECWVWKGCHARSGDGVMTILGRQMTARRVSWFLFVGSIPSGARVMRRCPTPACVNPAHAALRPGTGTTLNPEVVQTIRREAEQGT